MEKPYGDIVAIILDQLGVDQAATSPSDIQSCFAAANRNVLFGGKDVILLLDDVDNLGKMKQNEREQLLSFLSALKRQRQLMKEKSCLHAALAITNVVQEYLRDTLGNSPFNTLNPVLAPYFTLEEHNELFTQYELQEGIKIDARIKANIYKQTNGAPGLEQLFGKCYHDMRQRLETPPSFAHWMAETSSRNFFSYVQEQPNFARIIDFLEKDTNADVLDQLVSVSFPLPLSKQIFIYIYIYIYIF